MEKEELVAMIGERNIGGWWTSGRILMIILGILLAGSTIYHGSIFPLQTGTELSFLFFLIYIALILIGIAWSVFIIIIGVRFFTPRISNAELKVKKINKDRTKAEVSGKDGKKYTVHVNKTELCQDQESSFLTVSGEVNRPWKVLIVGSDINEIWGK